MLTWHFLDIMRNKDGEIKKRKINDKSVSMPRTEPMSFTWRTFKMDCELWIRFIKDHNPIT